MKLDVFDTKGKVKEKIELSKGVFGVEPNTALLNQYIRVYRTNQRQGTSKVKDRSEVRGGGKKPWRQKGTGRARHGSIRSPLWRKGGIVHGPTPKSWHLSLPKQLRKSAIVSVLSQAAKDKKVHVIDKIDIKKPKTKQIVEILDALKLRGKTLLVLAKPNENVLKSARNIKNLKTVIVENVNGYDLLNCKNVLFEKDAIEIVDKKYLKGTKK